MLRRHPIAVAMAMLALLVPGAALASARLTSVVPQDGGCVAGPTGPNVEAWDVQPGKTYTVRLENVTNCAHGGTDATLGILVMSTSLGNIPLTAKQVSTGVYEFDYLVPALACATAPVRYGVIGEAANTGFVAGRHDDGTAQAHLRASAFYGSCEYAYPIVCKSVPTLTSTWGQLKSIYR